MVKKPTDDKPAPWMTVPQPARRHLRIYSRDPSSGSYLSNTSVVGVSWEPLRPGPMGARVAVVDYDAGQGVYYPPVDLEHPHILASDGLHPSESDPRFHQQMVYAVAMRTIEMFETALGRRVYWRRADRTPEEIRAKTRSDKHDIRRLHLYPHAMQEANAYYSREARGILFGYFPANCKSQGSNLPGQRVFTCLSHDIVAHEVTHAIIDGIRTYFTEPTNPDVLAFHEGFADLAALFAHFSQDDTLIDAIQRTGGRLYLADLSAEADATGPAAGDPVIAAQRRQANPLIQLAQQFGEARGASRGLRSALGTPPTPDAYSDDPREPHARGAILVAAVFDAYFTVYTRRTADLFRIYHAGGGARDGVDLPAPLASQLAKHASELAGRFFRMCARALDYCPPVDVTFGDFLRALITVAMELHPTDTDGVRDAIKQAFRLRGIYPDGANFFSDDALQWPPVLPGTLPPISPRRVKLPGERSQLQSLQFGGPHGLTKREQDINGDILRAYMNEHARLFGLDPTLDIAVPSFHSMHHIHEDGTVRLEMVIEAVQTRETPLDPLVPKVGGIPFRGGVTVIVAAPRIVKDPTQGSIALDPEIHYVIGKPIHGPEGVKREKLQRFFALTQGFAEGDDHAHFEANFRMLHEEG